jgi:hypothetical protein
MIRSVRIEDVEPRGGAKGRVGVVDVVEKRKRLTGGGPARMSGAVDKLSQTRSIGVYDVKALVPFTIADEDECACGAQSRVAACNAAQHQEQNTERSSEYVNACPHSVYLDPGATRQSTLIGTKLETLAGFSR